MIVLDEQLEDPRLVQLIEQWYKGAVIYVSQLRPQTVIKDDAMPTVLRRARQPTFVTINYSDFWRRIPASANYCIICLKLSAEQKFEVSGILRGLLNLPELRTKGARMGRVVSIRRQVVEMYRTS
jgi:hypothetical protein